MKRIVATSIAVTSAAAFAIAASVYLLNSDREARVIGNGLPSSSTPAQKQEPSLFSKFQFPIPIKPAPTPRSERDEAIHNLSAHGLEPTGIAASKVLEQGGPIALDLFLKAGVKAEECDAQGRPLLVVASAAGRAPEALSLLLAGANPNATTPDGQSALMVAARKGHRAVLESLVNNGAELTLADPEGHTALHHAILAGNAEAVHWLIEAGATATATAVPCCHGEKTASLHAFEAKNPELLETVIAHERPEQWHPALATALLEAARTGDRALATILLTHHQEAPLLPGSRQPLLGYAIAWGETETLRLLLECGADANTPLNSPVDNQFAALVEQKSMRYYLEKEGGLTLLMLAASRGDLPAVEALLDHGAKKNALTSKSKWAALSFAAQSKSVEVMQRLLGKSPRPEDQHTRIEISLANQTAQFWKNNALALTTRISTGRSGYRTPSGRFVVTDKTRNRVSTIYKVNMPYFMRLNCSAIGMHAGVVPGHPASHGCIRVPSGNAARLFREVPVGTLVIIR